MRHEFDIPNFPQQNIWEDLTSNVPLQYQAKDRQQWALAAWGIEKPAERLVYFQEALTDAHWVELLQAYKCGDLSAIGQLFDRAIRTQEMMARVDAEPGE